MFKKNRLLKGYTQEELAEKLDISTRQLQRIEAYQCEPKLLLLRKIIKTLNISDEDIIKYIKGKK